jgi:hypothetical protein
VEESGAIEKTQSGQQGRRSDEEIQGVVIRVLPPKLAHACTDGRVFRQAPRSLGYDGGWSVALGCTKITQSIIYTQQPSSLLLGFSRTNSLQPHFEPVNKNLPSVCSFVFLILKLCVQSNNNKKIPDKIRGVLLKLF